MAQQLRALAALPNDLGSIPSTYLQLTTVCNSSSRSSNNSHRYTCRLNTNAHKIKIIFKRFRKRKKEMGYFKIHSFKNHHLQTILWYKSWFVYIDCFLPLYMVVSLMNVGKNDYSTVQVGLTSQVEAQAMKNGRETRGSEFKTGLSCTASL